MTIDEKWLPDCLSHLNDPYLKDTDDSVIIGQLSDVEIRGYKGLRKLHTALVPVERLDEVLSAPGDIGWDVESWGPGPVVDKDKTYKSGFWIQGPRGQEDRLEPIVVSWEHHNKTVMMPDNGLLMCYGLCPKVFKEPDRIIWDDLSRPEYSVITVKPLSHYDVYSYTGAEVAINRKYLEDYASLKGCAVVAVYYEERYCEYDKKIESLLGENEGENFKYPGHSLTIKRDRHYTNNGFLCQIWGRRLVLTPSSRPVTDEQEPELEWPGFSGIMTQDRAMRTSPLDYVYVTDQVLDKFEGKPEFEVIPSVGCVSYNGWWSLLSCRRISRDFIVYEIKKIYEGCPPSVIQHVHRFAVCKEIAESQEAKLGEQNIAKRTGALIDAYLNLGDMLISISDSFGFPFAAHDFIGLNRDEVKYHGWWTRELLKPLGYRAPLDMTRGHFLKRCGDIYKLLEGMKEGPFRRLLIEIGILKDKISNLKTLKLLETVLQLCKISKESELHLVEQKDEIVKRWDEKRSLEIFRPLFALVELRTAATHSLGEEESSRVHTALEVYGLNENETTTGWGRALDRVYDELTITIREVCSLLDLSKK